MTENYVNDPLPDHDAAAPAVRIPITVKHEITPPDEVNDLMVVEPSADAGRFGNLDSIMDNLNDDLRIGEDDDSPDSILWDLDGGHDTRSAAAPRDAQSREQMNGVSSFVDASNVYGEDTATGPTGHFTQVIWSNNTSLVGAKDLSREGLDAGLFETVNSTNVFAADGVEAAANYHDAEEQGHSAIELQNVLVTSYNIGFQEIDSDGSQDDDDDDLPADWFHAGLIDPTTPQQEIFQKGAIDHLVALIPKDPNSIHYEDSLTDVFESNQTLSEELFYGDFW